MPWVGGEAEEELGSSRQGWVRLQCQVRTYVYSSFPPILPPPIAPLISFPHLPVQSVNMSARKLMKPWAGGEAGRAWQQPPRMEAWHWP